MDGLNVHGRTKDITLVGSARRTSTTTRATRPASRAASSGRCRSRRRVSTTAPITSTSRSRACRRSIPTKAIDFVGKPADYGQKVRDDYTEHGYHQPSDVVRPDWDLSGAREDLKVFFAVGYRVARGRQVSAMEAGQRVPKREA